MSSGRISSFAGFFLFFLLRAAGGSPCSLPDHWHGSWFQSGVRGVISITAKELSSKGECMQDLHEKYIFRHKTKNCYRCVVISEKHPNILQYKETLCENNSNGKKLCSQIPGDALLFSLFRRHVLPRPCPLKGPLTFSYNQGYGVCSMPLSTIDSCTSDSKLLFKYQACPDVIRTESLVERVECIGHWKEGSTRYFVGLIDSRKALTDEDQYRCFAWEKRHNRGRPDEPDYMMAQSGDATCNGVTSATDGSRTLKIKKLGNYTGCQYPWWVSQHRHWHTLDHRVSYTITHNNTTIKLSMKHGQPSDDEGSGASQGKMVCASAKEISNEKATIISHATTDCVSGYICTVFHKRDNHIIEIQRGSQAQRIEDACSAPYFNFTHSAHVTLTGGSIGMNSCPLEGIWGVTHSNCEDSLTHLRAGCGLSPHSIEFLSNCDTKKISRAYMCHGSWSEGSSTYVIVSPTHQNTHKHCLVMSRASPKPVWDDSHHGWRSVTGENSSFTIEIHPKSCPRQIYTPPVLSLNLTSYQSCVDFEVSSGSAYLDIGTNFYILALLWTIRLTSDLR